MEVRDCTSCLLAMVCWSYLTFATDELWRTMPCSNGVSNGTESRKQANPTAITMSLLFVIHNTIRVTRMWGM